MLLLVSCLIMWEPSIVEQITKSRHIKVLRETKVYVQKSFLSTSKNPIHNLTNFKLKNCLFTIKSKTGKYITRYVGSSFKEEQEDIFPPDTEFTITSITTDPQDSERFLIEMFEK
jgi:hypothetical protein